MGEFKMPSLGADMEAGTLVEWLKRPGDPVANGDIIAVVETQKGAIEVEVFETGTVDRLLVEVGATVPVGTPLALIAAKGAAAAAMHAPTAAPLVAPERGPPPEAPPSRPTPPPVVSLPATGAVAVSPAARKLAAEHGIDLGAVVGSGPAGEIRYVDVETAVRGLRLPSPPSRAPAPPTPAMPAAPARPPAKGPDLGHMRAAIAAAMSRSKREIPHYYLAHRIAVDPLIAWLAKANASQPPATRLLPGALYIKALARTLAKFPEFNGFYRDGAFRPAAAIHIGVAIALRGGGLVAPAIHDCDRLPVAEVMTKLRDLVNRVRAGRFRSSEIADPTITLTSLGDRGVEGVFGVIYPPQVAIVGIGTPARAPWVENDAVAVRTVATLTVAADHRVSDGHRGALLLADLAQRLQNPEAL